jgi:hypothetical protein
VHGTIWYPIFLDLNKLGGALNHLLHVKVGYPELSVTCVHASEVLVDSVHLNAPVNCLVGFHAFEALN